MNQGSSMGSRFGFTVLVANFIIIYAGSVHAHSGGASGYSGNPAVNGGKTCLQCHGGGVAPVVTIMGPTSVLPGSLNQFTLRISGGQNRAGGLDVSANSGALAVSDPGTSLASGDITHNAPRAATNGVIDFTFKWQAPNSGGASVLYAAGNSVDDNGKTSGDSSTAVMLNIAVSQPTNQAPVANAGGPYSATLGSAIQFDGSRSSDADGSIASYQWQFGDGQSAVGSKPTHLYAAQGNYTVTLKVTDNLGASSTASATAAVSAPANQVPAANAGGPYSTILGNAIQFDGSLSSDADGSIVSYEWQFGDGQTALGSKPTHVYAAQGSYTVTLTVTDNVGAKATASTTASVTLPMNSPPKANAGGPYSTIFGNAIQFDGSRSSDADGSIVSYSWNLGDGSAGSGPLITHTYSSAGTFTITLTVTDDKGATASASTTATVNAPVNLSPVADPGGPYASMLGSAISFNGSASSDPDGSVVSYAWQLGDGAAASGPAPSHTYATAGTYTVSLKVTDDNGASAQATTIATVKAANLPPIAYPGGPYVSSRNRIRLSGTGSSDPDGTIVSYVWDFGDGTSGTGSRPAHRYAAGGIYNVTLTVTDDNGASASASTTVTISSNKRNN
jgi:PKD repeat protein